MLWLCTKQVKTIGYDTSIRSAICKLFKKKMFVLISFIGPAIDGTDENVYVNIFSLRNFVHLNEVAILFESTYGMSLSTVATTEFEGNEIGNALVSICNYNF
jgi:hypothetical protein